MWEPWKVKGWRVGLVEKNVPNKGSEKWVGLAILDFAGMWSQL